MLAFFDECSASSSRIINSPIFAWASMSSRSSGSARSQAPGADVPEHALPAFQFVGGDLALARHRIEGLAAKQADDHLGLPLHAPPLRELRALAGHEPLARCCHRLPQLLSHRPPWSPP